ncbi:hypothetical protein I316_00065 [Kwoniella heveanensis BCC8398]|uniref:Zn(2)-C6 fungal-type domain-containing protein n=1 Tax=Kwoniella heveanensis BCC8398 TaxID=1296120 RepID=A0A1B9H3I8_9TREE|nr:hypothetical protein I316_00065 [Kwoniella heveanensis BCC8398]
MTSEGGSSSRRHADRRNASRACDHCRSRKTRCTGEMPRCQLCERTGRSCSYSLEADRRMTDRSALNKLEKLQERVYELEHLLAASGSDPVPSNLTNRSDVAPFETGRLILSSTGNLHLHPSATFYCPAYVKSDWEHVLDSLSSSRSVVLPGYLATYLPFPMSREHHRLLIDLAFDCQLCFGPNPFKDKFIDAMDSDPDSRTFYFSPCLHLCVLALGWRYCHDPEIIAMYYPNNSASDRRGVAFVDRARDMILAEADTAHLSNTLALFAMSLFYVGIHNDRLGGSCLMMGQYQCMDSRLHKRCDVQLRELGQEPGSELDIARRDVWGFALNYSAWFSTFYAQPALPLSHSADQRPPHVHHDAAQTDTRLLSVLVAHHSSLSQIGLKTLSVNHLLRLPIDVRVKQVREVGEQLLGWRATLPLEVTWPPPLGGPVMHPGNIVTHGMHATYIILLYRPYIIEFGGERHLVPDALEKCLRAAKDIVDQASYLVKHYGVHRAPLSWQHTVYVCGTMLVLQAAGLPDITGPDRLWALESLVFLRRLLDQFAAVWPAAGQTAASLRQLQEEYTFYEPVIITGSEMPRSADH